jgi:transglutaminase-like putative cysteine protease
MRIQIEHTTRYDYDTPTKGVIQLLRLTPRPHDGQHVLSWRVELDGDARLNAGEDVLGNITHLFNEPGPIKRLEARVFGEVDTRDTGGVVQGAVERFPPVVFLRETALTQPDAAIRDFALAETDKAASTLEKLHALLGAVSEQIAFDTDATKVATSAAQAFALKRGVCQDLTQIFVTAARVLGVPARYVSGHLSRTEQVEQAAAHAWAEAYVDNLGWVGFDAVNGLCPTETYVRVAIGLDYLSAAPVRGSRQGGGTERLDVKLRVTPSFQNQS